MSPDGLRARKKQRTRLLLASKGLELFFERGFDRVTIRDIADAAEVSPRTFFRYFPSKDEIIFGPWRDDLDILRAELRNHARNGRDAIALRDALVSYATWMEQQESVIRMRAQVIIGTPQLQSQAARVRDEWAEGVAEEFARYDQLDEPSDRHLLVGGLAMMILMVGVRRWLREGGSLPTIVRRLCDTAGRLFPG